MLYKLMEYKERMVVGGIGRGRGVLVVPKKHGEGYLWGTLFPQPLGSLLDLLYCLGKVQVTHQLQQVMFALVKAAC